MKSKALLLLAFFTCFATSLYAVEFRNKHILDKSKRSNIIKGFWNFGFPVSSAEYGYMFLPDNKFIYFRLYGDHTGYTYVTVGEWKEERLRLYLNPEYHYNNRSGEIVQREHSHNNWLYVCDLRSYNHYWYPQEDDKSYPPAISIKIFDHGQLTHYVDSYFKIYDIKRTMRTFDDFIEKYL